ncbi:hypothetical protein SCHPADRAFT_937886 [Schizopora paradoxa]|uniref:DUF6533 domain-containing protein n=1 Tax=Schizopora paradoxa TaxID=27342 RepID=A0A0H2RWM5_9AGAM|nr:hypothetical protein SCHPADRAFT_937886 [Schizopora paradoxa]
MSSNISEEIVWNVLVFRYTIAATISLVAYEYLINLDNEIQYLWSHRFKLGSCLLFLCRYLPVLDTSIAIFEFGLNCTFSYSECKSMLKFSFGLIYLQYCLSNVVLYTHTYAVWGGGKRLLALLIGSYTLSVAGGVYSLHVLDHGAYELHSKPWIGCIVTNQSFSYGCFASVLVDSSMLFPYVLFNRFEKLD